MSKLKCTKFCTMSQGQGYRGRAQGYMFGFVYNKLYYKLVRFFRKFVLFRYEMYLGTKSYTVGKC